MPDGSTFLRDLDTLAMRSVLNDAPFALIAVDHTGTIVEENSRAAGMFGYDTLIGLVIEELVPVRLRNAHLYNREEFQRQPLNRPMAIGLELYGLRSDGSEFAIDVQIGPDRMTPDVTWAWISETAERARQLDLARMKEALGAALHDELAFLTGEGGASNAGQAPPSSAALVSVRLTKVILGLLIVVTCILCVAAVHTWIAVS